RRHLAHVQDFTGPVRRPTLIGILRIAYRRRPDFAGPGVRIGGDQDTVDDTKNRRSRSDAESQREQRDHGEPGPLAKYAQCVTKVLPKSREKAGDIHALYFLTIF